MTQNLILLPDSPYSDWIIERSEKVAVGVNRYVCYSNSFKYNSNPKILRKDYLLSLNKRDANSYQKVIIHYHNELSGFFLEKNNIPKNKVIWVLWSGDLYNTPFYNRAIYKPLTNQFIGSNNLYKLQGLKILKEILKYFLKMPGYFDYKRSFQRIGTIASFFEKDVENAALIFNKDYKRIIFAILSFEEMIRGLPEKHYIKLGEKILLGHAGVPENNHLDLFQRILSLNSSRTLLCPLSYGESSYIQKVVEKGEELFGYRIEFVRDFMPRDEYYLKLSEVKFAIFDTLIQQAFGNILGLLYLGVKVFLNEENSIYYQLKKMGLLIFSINNLSSEIEIELTIDQINTNREILIEYFSEEKINDYYKLLLN
ncbi:TDP-N-acetylfucosamine:lipid II N-acetylfucosaminyltransferase [Algoriphagus sp. AK58]|uniref:TDP-N-acetylfucosamine:lipid II N-acetylfucosaminyltransferase n=1 Tax=Algoriphagus sp. AK58 TaxID=1406877 RepID=UPI001650B023|nr:TDP-N-acetylfucosamine:lipid II N-acetylfucosaminyltransferase [Algoriphagus sp. AK58]MBC6367458.1 hypothetical protein [Algoriphagus sp. AK58]